MDAYLPILHLYWLNDLIGSGGRSDFGMLTTCAHLHDAPVAWRDQGQSSVGRLDANNSTGTVACEAVNDGDKMRPLRWMYEAVKEPIPHS